MQTTGTGFKNITLFHRFFHALISPQKAHFINILRWFWMQGEKELKKRRILFSALLFIFQLNAEKTFNP